MLIIFINIGIFVKKNYDKHIYNEIIKAFIPIEIDEINENIDKGNSMYLYIGRNSCYWCRLLVSPLSEIVETNNIKLYYLDLTDRNEAVDSFLVEYDVKSIPCIFYFDERKGIKINIENSDNSYPKDILESNILSFKDK